MYSCIAGFLDAGETLEDCVRREAAEEVGIEVHKVGISVLNQQNLKRTAVVITRDSLF